jgi:23S rRNA (pseudouridine1915-N3)-methyltransferase
LILRHVRPQDELVLLDERGKRRNSLAFASWLEDKLSRGGKDLVFVVGGAYGFATEVYDRADSSISLSEMTFSHQIVRTIFAEQLYRAFTIIRGEPYHHQ